VSSVSVAGVTINCCALHCLSFPSIL
jgi:hypothetical protein